MNLMRASYDFDFGAALVQERGRFECGLAASDHEHLFSSESSEFALLRCVRGQRTREPCKFWRSPGERPDAGSNDQTACKDRPTLFEVESEAPCFALHSGNFAPIEVGHCLALIPESIADE